MFTLPLAEMLVAEAFVRVVCPFTVSVVTVVVPRVDDAEVIVVKDGFGDTAIVEVPEKMMFAPAVRNDTGVLKKLVHCVVDAESGIENPEDGARENVCVPVDVAVAMKISRPLPLEVARDWDATVDPFNEVIVPPAPPASVPHKNDPPNQRSFSVDALHAERDAPKRDARVSEDAVVVAK